jgi:hypothetical protein
VEDGRGCVLADFAEIILDMKLHKHRDDALETVHDCLTDGARYGRDHGREMGVIKKLRLAAFFGVLFIEV